MTRSSIDLGRLLHEQGYRLTPQRQLILDIMCAMPGHATPEAVWRRTRRKDPRLHRVTVYRSLEFLCDVGVLTSTMSPDGHVAYELAGEEHHHLICRGCGGQLTIPHTLFAPLLSKVKHTYGFQVIEGTHLSLFGLCRQCQPRR